MIKLHPAGRDEGCGTTYWFCPKPGCWNWLPPNGLVCEPCSQDWSRSRSRSGSKSRSRSTSSSRSRSLVRVGGVRVGVRVGVGVRVAVGVGVGVGVGVRVGERRGVAGHAGLRPRRPRGRGCRPRAAGGVASAAATGGAGTASGGPVPPARVRDHRACGHARRPAERHPPAVGMYIFVFICFIITKVPPISAVSRLPPNPLPPLLPQSQTTSRRKDTPSSRRPSPTPSPSQPSGGGSSRHRPSQGRRASGHRL